ncbi:hypothetical protein AGMMS49992_22120 [Clostridia bacterium]|nr:hypothetical protein AGMMS49992_22120 [Clostridia bacterium]
MKTRIQQTRNERGLTQLQVADALGINKQTVCEWERGRTFPRVTTLRRLATLFGVSIDYLLAQEGGKTRNHSA